MPLFDVEVDETRHYTVIYRIEADDEKQAAAMAEEGNTIGESGEQCQGVINRGVCLDTIKEVPLFVRVEYDLNFHGGDYHGVGDFAFIPQGGLTDENLPQRFQNVTGYGPEHIIHYTFDELYTAEGESIDDLALGY